eukprot:Skav207446  [mRNA]  locus=scaffold1959:462658:465825:- [translate_table: standard]
MKLVIRLQLKYVIATAASLKSLQSAKWIGPPWPRCKRRCAAWPVEKPSTRCWTTAAITGWSETPPIA